MSLFKKLFGDLKEEPKDKNEKPQRFQKAVPLKNREKIQILQTVSGKNYKIVRGEGKVGVQIDHYQYYDDNGKKIEDFTKVLWMFDSMVKGRLSSVIDHV